MLQVLWYVTQCTGCINHSFTVEDTVSVIQIFARGEHYLEKREVT